MKTRNSLLLLSTASLFACGTLVGADFDDRNLDTETSGGNVTTSGGAPTQGGQTAGGTAGKGGATQATGGSSGSSGGSTVTGGGGATATGGNAGQTSTGGATSGGAATTGGNSTGGVGPAGNGGQGAEGGAGADGGLGGFGGAGGETQGGAGGEPGVAGAGGEGGGGTPPGPAVVVLNEVKAQGSGDDFIEIYNLGPGALALEGYGLSDQNNTFIFPSGASIAEGGHVLLLLGQTAPVNGNYQCFTPNPCYHATWGVSQDGEAIYFRGLQNQALDQTVYPDQRGAGGLANDQTWGRLPDGMGTFRATRPTPEARNQATPSG